MKTLLTVLYGACLAASLNFAQADDSSAATAPTETPKKAEKREKPKLTEEQKQLRKDILAKYDTNKDGKLDRDERAKISLEDKEKMKKAGMGGNGAPPRKANKAADKAPPKSGSESTGAAPVK